MHIFLKVLAFYPHLRQCFCPEKTYGCSCILYDIPASMTENVLEISVPVSYAFECELRYKKSKSTEKTEKILFVKFIIVNISFNLIFIIFFIIYILPVLNKNLCRLDLNRNMICPFLAVRSAH